MNLRNCAVPLVRCDDTLISTDDIKIISVYSKDKVIDNKSIEVKRSTRLSRKRSFQDKSFIEYDDQSYDVQKKKSVATKLKSNKTKFIKSEEIWNNSEKASTHISTKHNTNKSSGKVSYVQFSSSTTEEAKELLPISARSSLKSLRNTIPSKSVNKNKTLSTVININKDNLSDRQNVDKKDNFVATRKRGRPPLKKLKVQKANEIVTCDDQKVKTQTMVDNEQHNLCEAEAFKQLKNYVTEVEREAELSKVENQLNGENVSVVNFGIKGSDLCSPEVISCSSEIVTVPIMSTKTVDSHDQPSCSETFDRQVLLLSKRFNIPVKTLRHKIIKESLPIFSKHFSEIITPSMITVSPIVKVNFKQDNFNADYKIEHIRHSIAYEQNNLKNLMDELSKTMPSWCLAITLQPRRFVIACISIGPFGVPTSNKSIVLDKHFRALVYINNCLEYKYCKFYQSASEIIILIKDLNNL